MMLYAYPAPLFHPPLLLSAVNPRYIHHSDGLLDGDLRRIEGYIKPALQLHMPVYIGSYKCLFQFRHSCAHRPFLSLSRQIRSSSCS